MSEKIQYIPSRIRNAAVNGHVTGAVDIIDDSLGRNQEQINADTYRKEETYSKEQLDNLITTPEQQYVTVVATDETTPETLAALINASGEGEAKDTVYRVGNWDGEQYDPTVYTEYAWDGTQYIPLDTKQYTLATAEDFIEPDAEKRAKIPTVGAVADVCGAYEENPEWVRLIVDGANRIVWGVKADGSINWSKGIPTPIQKKLDELGGGEQNKEYIYALVDSSGHLLYGVKGNGGTVMNFPKIDINKDTILGDNLVNAIKMVSPSEDRDNINGVFILPETPSDIIATFDNIVVKMITIEDVEYLMFSNSNGFSWSDPIENIVGDIVHTHIFSDGTVLLCNYTGAYYVAPGYTEIQPSTIYDVDGSIYSDTTRMSYDSEGNPTGEVLRKGFYSQMYKDRYFFHNGVEMEVFGEYINEETGEMSDREKRNALHARLWYSTDKGHTLKCALENGVSQIYNAVTGQTELLEIKHFHYAGYCDTNNKFYISTGDWTWESMLIEGEYNVNDDTWTFRIIGEGNYFKFGYHWYDDKYAYLLTDYTSNDHPEMKGILRCPLNGLNNISNYRNLYICPSEEWGEIAIVNIFIDDKNGYKVLFPDYLGYGYIWVATDGYKFKKVELSKNWLIGMNTIGPNLNGDVLSLCNRRDGNDGHLFRNLINLTEMFRENGLSDFMY